MSKAEAVTGRRSQPATWRDSGARDQNRVEERKSSEPAGVRSSWRLRLGTLVVLAAALTASVPTVGDLGLTWDEPAYRYSQVMSVQWWEQLGRARSWSEVQPLLDPQALLYYWPYGRFGINFHNPLAGQLNLAAHAVFGHWMKDIPARRMATVIEFALTITIGFHFLARRYGGWVGLVMAGSLLLMPRLYGQAHLMDTDTPGLLLWSATALAFWKGLHEPDARRWRVARRHSARPGVRREDGRGRRLAPALALADRGISAPNLACAKEDDTTGSMALLTIGCDAGSAGSGVPADRDAAAATPSAEYGRSFQPSCHERLAGRDPGRSPGSSG